MPKLKLIQHSTGWILQITTNSNTVDVPVSESDAMELCYDGVETYTVDGSRLWLVPVSVFVLL